MAADPVHLISLDEVTGGVQVVDRWQIEAPKAIAWREWGDEWVVHVETHAETHLLSAAAGQLLRALLEVNEPVCLESVFERAFGDSRSGGAVLTLDEREAAHSILGDLERKGIVVRLGS